MDSSCAKNPFLGVSEAIRRLEVEARSVALCESPVLIQGETGTGKGVLAAWLHANGPRAARDMIHVNCGSLSGELLESELFGHEKGAFTGAFSSKPGLLEVAHRGTLFLDEIGDMGIRSQPRLLKALEDQRFRRVGGVQNVSVDVRLIAATHQVLDNLVREGRFRNDLYFRISTLPMFIPPLRERPEDIPVLADHFLGQLSAELGRPTARLRPEARQALAEYSWPGNIRELRNVLERALLLAQGTSLCCCDLRLKPLGTAAEDWNTPSNLSLKEVEALHIQRVLREEHGRVTPAARRLGISKSSLYQKIKEYEIKSDF